MEIVPIIILVLVVFGALAYWLAVTDQRASLAAALVCLVGGQIVSYVKARAEGLGLSADVGVAERFERLILVGLGGLGYGFGVPHAFSVTLWLLAALSAVPNLVSIGRQGLFRYCNQNECMEMAIDVVPEILAGKTAIRYSREGTWQGVGVTDRYQARRA